MYRKWMFALAAVACVGTLAFVAGVFPTQIRDALGHVTRTTGEAQPPPRDQVHKPDTPSRWDGTVSVTPDEARAIGLGVVTVKAQVDPIKLELTGKTAYDPDTLTKIRPRFDTLVEHVYAALGQKVKAGQPLVALHSTELASAKSDLQSKYVQWQHDLRLLNLRKELIKTGAISKQLWVDTINDEKKSRLEYTLSRDRLNVLKVPEAEIGSLLAPLRDAETKADPASNRQEFGSIDDKAKMTLVSPVDGVVIEREVVPQNFYDTSSVLMVIAPLDHLWVLVNVYELDQDKVKVGQTMEIQFPFLEQKVVGKVQYVANEVSKETRAVRVRASIPNPGARLKADMLVKAMIEIPPGKGQTVIPRLSMVASDGTDYVFVRKPGQHSTETGDRFERRAVEVAQENHDRVIVARGLAAGEEVASDGSLILAQIYEDARTVATGLASD